MPRAELRKLEADHGELPATVEVDHRTRPPSVFQNARNVPVRNSPSKIAPGIDVRGDGGYVMAPPSIHPSGQPYAWSVDSHNALGRGAGLAAGEESPSRNGNGAQPTAAVGVARAGG